MPSQYEALVTPIILQDERATAINPGGAYPLSIPLGNTDTITARAGGGQALATALPTEFNRVTVVATAGDSVVLPASVPGLDVVVINHGAKAMQVFGLAPDTIDDVATGTGVSHMPNSMVFYTCISAGAWYSEGLASGFGGPGLQTLSSTDAITAFATGGQGGAIALTTMLSRITIVGTAGDSVKLPISAAGMQITVINAAAANSLNVFPAVGEFINLLAVNTALAVAVTKNVVFTCVAPGTWHSIVSA